MSIDAKMASAFISALRLAGERGGAAAALAESGAELPEPEHFAELGKDFERLLGRSVTDTTVRESLALGYLAGRVSARPRMRGLQDPTCFLMDRDLVVQHAEGEPILRLPWFDDDLFVGRQLPDITEMPSAVRDLAVDQYQLALDGEVNRFAFWSYGHAYSVDALPVRDERGRRGLCGAPQSRLPRAHPRPVGRRHPSPGHQRDGSRACAQSTGRARDRALDPSSPKLSRPAGAGRESEAAPSPRVPGTIRAMNGGPSAATEIQACPRCSARANEGGWCGVCGADLVPEAKHLRFSRWAQERAEIWERDPDEARRLYTERTGRSPDASAQAIDVSKTATTDLEPETDEKTCPDCAELVKAAARKCRFCGYRFDEPHQPWSSTPEPPSPGVPHPPDEGPDTAIITLGYVFAILLPVVGFILGLVAVTRLSRDTNRHGIWILALSVLAFIIWYRAVNS